MIKRIHINQHIHKRNKKLCQNKPDVTVKAGGKNYYCNEVEFIGEGSTRLANGLKNPLSCGATKWIETTQSVRLISENKKMRMIK